MAHARKQGAAHACRAAGGGTNSRRSVRVVFSRWTFALTCLTVSLAVARGQSPNEAPRLPDPGVQLAAQPPAPQPATPPEPAPPPRRATDSSVGPVRPRMEGLAAGVLPLGATPAPTKAVIDRFGNFVTGIDDPQNNLDLIVGRPRVMHLKEAPFRIQVADEGIMSYNILGRSPKELTILGRNVGSTVFNMWFGDPEDVSKQTLLSYVVHVLPDPEIKERLERTYKALEDEINRAFPDDYVCLFLVGDKLVVSGEAKDSMEATKILQVIRASAPGIAGSPAAAIIPTNNINLNVNSPLLGPNNPPTPALENYILQGESNIINLLRIPGEQQVMLRVTVAEVSRAAARQIGLNFAINNNHGIQVFAQNTGGLIQSRFGGATTALNAAANSIANLPAAIDNGQIPIAIQALRNVNLARSLAEPNLVTLNGHPAQFKVGGEFPVPVVTGATAVGLSGVSFVPFGVQLQFTPYITDKDRIRLQLNASVSVRDVATGANFGTGNSGNTFVPGLNDRTITTTVEMREGQTLAIGGLLQTNLGGDTSRVPLFGDLPFGGQIFRVDHTSASESELVLLVTPELVHPMEPNQIPPLPGSDYFEPGDLEFYLFGRLESRRSYDYRSPVMDDCARMKAYRHCELLYFVGPHGHCDEK
jgi:pilus assembly protein CpaC